MTDRMTGRRLRGVRALIAGGVGALVALAAVVAAMVLSGEQAPPVPVIPALVLTLPLAGLAFLSGPWPLRALSLAMFTAGWAWLTELAGRALGLRDGVGFLPGEGIGRALPATAPALLALGGAVLIYLLILRWLNRG